MDVLLIGGNRQETQRSGFTVSLCCCAADCLSVPPLVDYDVKLAFFFFFWNDRGTGTRTSETTNAYAEFNQGSDQVQRRQLSLAMLLSLIASGPDVVIFSSRDRLWTGGSHGALFSNPSLWIWDPEDFLKKRGVRQGLWLAYAGFPQGRRSRSSWRVVGWLTGQQRRSPAFLGSGQRLPKGGGGEVSDETALLP